MSFQIISPIVMSIDGKDFEDALRNFLKINHVMNIERLIISDQTQRMMANIKYYSSSGKRKVHASMMPTPLYSISADGIGMSGMVLPNKQIVNMKTGGKPGIVAMPPYGVPPFGVPPGPVPPMMSTLPPPAVSGVDVLPSVIMPGIGMPGLTGLPTSGLRAVPRGAPIGAPFGTPLGGPMIGAPLGPMLPGSVVSGPVISGPVISGSVLPGGIVGAPLGVPIIGSIIGGPVNEADLANSICRKPVIAYIYSINPTDRQARIGVIRKTPEDGASANPNKKGYCGKWTTIASNNCTSSDSYLKNIVDIINTKTRPSKLFATDNVDMSDFSTSSKPIAPPTDVRLKCKAVKRISSSSGLLLPVGNIILFVFKMDNYGAFTALFEEKTDVEIAKATKGEIDAIAHLTKDEIIAKQQDEYKNKNNNYFIRPFLEIFSKEVRHIIGKDDKSILDSSTSIDIKNDDTPRKPSELPHDKYVV